MMSGMSELDLSDAIESPRADGPPRPSKKQVEANNLSRSLELSTLYGSWEQGLVLNQTLNNQDLTSDDVTASAVASTAVGNATGFITAILVHFCFRDYYRTGKYQLFLDSQAPNLAAKVLMQKNDISIYLDGEKIKYCIRESDRNYIQGTIEDKDIQDQDPENREALTTLKRLVRQPGEQQSIPPACKSAFLRLTNHRRHTFSGRTSTNPLYRACKTWSAAGARAGAVLSVLIGPDNPNKRRIISFIFADIFCILFGFFGVLYFVVRDKILKIPANTKHQYDLTGLEGWSKYAKTALTFGTAVGQGVGGLIIAIANAASSSLATVSSFSISFWGGVIGLGSFVASLIFIPVINWVSSKFTKDGKGILTSENKNKFRNNYTRSGLTLGAGIGAGLGLAVGSWFFGLVMAATVFSALGAVIGGIALSVYGYKIHRELHGRLPPWNSGRCDLRVMEAAPTANTEFPGKHSAFILVQPNTDLAPTALYFVDRTGGKPVITQFVTSSPTTGQALFRAGETLASFLAALYPEPNDLDYHEIINLKPAQLKQAISITGHTESDNKEDIENSWDYVTRCTASVFGFIGAAVVCAINPAMALLLVPIGTAIASSVGWCLGLLIMKRARYLKSVEDPALTLPWTQRITTGANIGSIVGGCIGLVFGLAGCIMAGPAGMIFAVSLFGAIGAVVGGLAGALYDEKARSLIWRALNPWSTPLTPDSPQSTARTLSTLEYRNGKNRAQREQLLVGNPLDELTVDTRQTTPSNPHKRTYSSPSPIPTWGSGCKSGLHSSESPKDAEHHMGSASPTAIVLDF